MTAQLAAEHKFLRRYLPILLLALGIYVVLPEFGSFRHSLALLRHSQLKWVGLALLATLLSFGAAAATYCFLAFRPLAYVPTLLVQFAANFVNRLLPAGIGALGANYAYLRHVRQAKFQAMAMVTVNNLLGVIGHGLIVLSCLVFYRRIPPLHGIHLGTTALWIAGSAVIAVGLLVWLAYRTHRVNSYKTSGIQLLGQMSSYIKRPERVLAGLSSSISLSLCNILSIWCCLQALQLQLPFAAVVLIYSLGVVLGSATPSPGGLGGVETGLVAGFLAYGIPAALALAAALLYRLVSYWLPLIIGALAFWWSRQLGLFSSGY